MSEQSHSPSQPRAAKGKRRWTILFACLLFLGLLYFASPWIIFRPLLTQRFAHHLGLVMNRPVSFQELSYSYTKGMTLYQLQIGRRKGFGEGNLFAAARIELPTQSNILLRPLELYGMLSGESTRPVKHLRIIEPHCWIVKNQNQVNISDLNAGEGIDLPALTYEIIEPIVHFVDVGPAPARKPQQMILPDLLCRLDPYTGQATLQGRLEPEVEQNPRVNVQGSVTVPRLRSQSPLRGGIQIEWENLDLGSILPALLPIHNVRSVDGVCDGIMHFRVTSRLHVEFKMDLSMRPLTVALGESEVWTIQEKSAWGLEGVWDTLAGDLEVTTLAYTIPNTLDVSNVPGTPALVYQPGAPFPLRLLLQGHTTASNPIQQSILDLLGNEAIEWVTQRDSRFQIDYRGHAQQAKLEMLLDASALGVRCAAWDFDLPGESQQMRTQWIRNDPQSLWLLNRASLSSDHVHADMHIVHHDRGLEFSGYVGLDDEAFDFKPHFQKPAGHPLVIHLSGSLPADKPGAIENTHMRMVHDDASISVTPEGASIQMATEIPESDWDRGELGRGQFDVMLHMPIKISGIEKCLPLFPSLGSFLKQAMPSASLNGDLLLGLSANSSWIHGDLQSRIRAELDCGSLGVTIPGVFRKPVGLPGQLDLDWIYDTRSEENFLSMQVDATLAGGRVRGLTEWVRDQDPRSLWTLDAARIEINADDVAQLASHAMGPYAIENYMRHAEGGLNLRWETRRNDARYAWNAHVDLTNAGFASLSDSRVQKKVRIPLLLDATGTLGTEQPDGDSASTHVTVDHMTGQLGGSVAHLWDSEWTFSHRTRQESVSSSAAEPLQLEQADLTGDWYLVTDDALLELLRRWFPELQPLAAIGSASGQGALEYQFGKWKMTTELDATALGVQWAEWFAKPIGYPAMARIDAHLLNQPDGDNPWHLQIDLAEIGIGSIQAQIKDRCVDDGVVENNFNGPRALNWKLDVPQLQELRVLLSGLDACSFEGSLTSQGQWFMDEMSELESSAFIAFQDALIESQDETLSLSGQVDYQQGQWSTELLEFASDSLQGRLTGQLTHETDAPEVNVQGWLSYLDPDDWSDVSEYLGLNAVETALPVRVDWNVIEQGWQSAGVDAFLLSQKFSAPDTVPVWMRQIEDAHHQIRMKNGQLDWQVRGSVSGGSAAISLEGPLPGRVSMAKARGVVPNEVTYEWIKHFFPGVSAFETLDYDYGSNQSEDPPSTVIAYGEIVAHNGVLTGKAAPDWVTVVFPRLNLSAFRFGRMHDWFTQHSDGSTEHQVIFQGRYYHLYASGRSLASGEAHYEIGLDLLAGLESKYWTQLENGRIPLFSSVTRWDDSGQILEEKVSYVPLRLVKAILWGSNPIHTAYQAIRKKIIEKE